MCTVWSARSAPTDSRRGFRLTRLVRRSRPHRRRLDRPRSRGRVGTRSAAKMRGFRAQRGTTCPACGQARPNIKGGLDDRAIARVAEQSSGASNHLAIQTSPLQSSDPAPCARQSTRAGRRTPTLATGRQHKRRTTRRDQDPDARFSEKRSSEGCCGGRGVDRSVGGAEFDACFHAKARARSTPLHSLHSGGPGQSSQPRLVETAQRYADGA